MLTLEQFNSLEVGDSIETDPLMAGLSEEPVKLRVSKVHSDIGLIEFVATYYGITLGRWHGKAMNDFVAWSIK